MDNLEWSISSPYIFPILAALSYLKIRITSGIVQLFKIDKLNLELLYVVLLSRNPDFEPCLSRAVRKTTKTRFTSDGFRRVERYNLVKIKSTQSEAEHPFRLRLRRRLSFSENYIVGFGSRKGGTNQSLCLIPCLVFAWFFSFRFQQSSFHWIMGDGVVSGIGKNGNALVLPILIPWRFSIFTASQAHSRLRRR